MKLLAIVFFVLLFGFIYIGDSFGQKEFVPAPREHPTLPEIYLQLTHRNSDGQLITYIEPTLMYLRNVSSIHNYLDLMPNKTIITKNEQSFELIEFEKTETFDGNRQMATYGLRYYGDFVLVFRHDAYLTHPGDTITAYWHIVRTVDR